MALDPNIILQAGNFKTPGYGETMELREAIMGRRAQQAAAARTAAEAQRKTTLLRDVGTQAATGDIAGARATALGGGDVDLAAQLSKMTEEQQKHAFEVSQRTAPLLLSLKKVPPEQRAAARDQLAPTLQEYGLPPQAIASLDLSDQGLDAKGAAASTIAEFYTREKDQRDFIYRGMQDQRQLTQSERNAYLSAGYLPPDGNGAASPLAGGSTGGTTGGRTQFGWTPRARNGGDNNDAAVDGKIAGMAKALGVDPDTPLSSFTPLQIAGALTLSEGGPGSIADRNNNPGNLTDPKTGAFRRFPTKAAGLQAAAAQVQRNLARGQTTIRTMVEGLPVSGDTGQSNGGLRPIPGGKLDRADRAEARAIAREDRADRKADEQATNQDRRMTVTMRKEFDATPESKTFRELRPAMQTIEKTVNAQNSAQNPNPQADTQLIYNFMRMAAADGSVIREGEFALVGKSASYSDQVNVALKKFYTGEKLTPKMRSDILSAAQQIYVPRREAYNEVANRYRGYAESSGLKPGEIAAIAVPTPARKPGTLTANIPTFTPQQARNAPKGTRFRTSDGRVMVRQ